MFLRHIQTVTAGSAVASISFSDIPQDGTDLVLMFSMRSSTTDGNTAISFNGSTANITVRTLYGSGSGVGTDSLVKLIAGQTPSNSTANTFANARVYITNYAGTAIKTFNFDGVQENNATESYQNILSGLWNQTAAITSVSLAGVTGNLATGSSASLYKVIAGTDRTTTVS